MEHSSRAQQEQLAHLGALIGEAPLNLVARGERSKIMVHIEEAAALAPLLSETDGRRWLDLGTGGGLPGLPLAILEPEWDWTLLDAAGKKIDAIDRFIEALGVQNATTLRGRAEDLGKDPALRGQFDGVVSRAVGTLSTVAELSRGFVRPGGVIAAIKGPNWREERPALDRAGSALGLGEIHSLPVAAALRPTWLVMMRAAGPVPRGIPRRNGLPHTRPLGGSSSDGSTRER